MLLLVLSFFVDIGIGQSGSNEWHCKWTRQETMAK